MRRAPRKSGHHSIRATPFRMATLLDRISTRASREPTRRRAHAGAWCDVGTPRTTGDDVDLELPVRALPPRHGRHERTHAALPARRRIFVATGTGIAPFLAEFEQAYAQMTSSSSDLATTSDDLTTRLDTPLPHVIRCVSREKTPETFHGRVTDYLHATGIDPQADYYVCGSAPHSPDISRTSSEAGGARVSHRILLAPHTAPRTTRPGPLAQPRPRPSLRNDDHFTSSSTQSRVRVTAFFHRR